MATTVAIGSTNPAKVRAVRRTASAVWPDAHYLPLSVDSGVGPMPMSDQEGARGALRRAERAQELAGADVGVGLEGAVQETPTGMYLTNWVAIVDRNGRRSIANGGRLPLPECIAQELRSGAELGPIIDSYSGLVNSKQHQGAAGYLTRGLVPRDLSFQIAVAYALAPFLRAGLYGTAQW